MGKTKSPTQNKGSPFTVSKKKSSNSKSSNITFEVKKKKNGKFSKVWPEFTEPDPITGKIKCKRCIEAGGEVAEFTPSSTTAAKRHLEDVHNFFPNAQNITWNVRINKKAIRVFTKMICIDLKSFNSMQTPSFKAFLQILNSNFKIPCVETIKKLMQELKTEEIDKIKILIHDETIYICLTTDLWSNYSKEEFMTMTAHFIDKNFNLILKELDTRKVEEAHKTGEVIEGILNEVEKSYEIVEKKKIYVVDGGKNVNSAMKNKKHLQCSIHLLNLAGKDNRGSIKTLIHRWKKVVSYFRKSPTASGLLEESQKKKKEEKILSVIPHVKTRFNSFHDMAERLDILYKNHIDKILKDLKPLKRLTPLEQECLKEFVMVTKPLKDATTILEGSKYVTASTRLVVVERIFFLLNALQGKCKTEEIETFRVGILNSLEKRFPSTDNVLVLAYVLDPRFRSMKTEFVAKEDIVKLLNKKYKKEKTKMGGKTIVLPEKKNKGRKQTSQVTLLSFLGVNDEEEEDDTIPLSDDEVDRYLKEKPIPMIEDPLIWWRENQIRFPVLSQLARKYLCIQATAAASERVWSAAGNIYTKKRHKLNAETATTQLFLHNNLAPIIEHLKEGDIQKCFLNQTEVIDVDAQENAHEVEENTEKNQQKPPRRRRKTMSRNVENQTAEKAQESEKDQAAEKEQETEKDKEGEGDEEENIFL